MVAALLGVALFLQASPRIELALDATHWDLAVDQLTARAFLEHQNPFTPEGAAKSGLAAFGPAGNGHPPTTSFWFLPLARMSSRTAAATLAWLSILLLFMQLQTTMKLLRYPAPMVSAWLLLTFILVSPFMKYHISVGQISALIGFLYFVAWYAGRSGDDWLAGASLGVACTLKAFPGAMVLLFLVTRRWRAVLSACIVYAGVAVYMTAGFGVASWGRFLKQQAPIADQWMSSIQNQSIHGIVLRLFQPVCVPHGPVLFSATLISTTIALILVAAASWLVYRPVREAGRDGGFDLSYALFVALSVVTSQWAWEHYTVIYALPVLILAAELVGWWRLKRFNIWVVIMLAIVGAVVASWQISIYTKGTLQSAVHRGAIEEHLLLHMYDLLNWGPGVVLLALLFVAVVWKRRDLTSRIQPGRDPIREWSPGSHAPGEPAGP